MGQIQSRMAHEVSSQLPQNTGRRNPQHQKRISEYLEPDEVNAVIRAAPSPKAKLLMLQQWRAGLRVSEAPDIEVRDPSPDTPSSMRVNWQSQKGTALLR